MNNMTKSANMKSMTQRSSFRALMLALAAVPVVLTGCAVGNAGDSKQPIQFVPGAGLSGSVHGGQQPVVGASVYMFAAGTTGYYSTNTNVLTNTSLVTGSDGSFTFGSGYTCTAGQQMYLVAVGGNPGSGTNANQTTVAAIGDCSTIGPSTFISMNEITTIAAAYALAPFATGYANIGTSSTNVNGLKRAFVNAAKLANVTTGVAPGTLPTGAGVNSQKVNALADILSSCVNSTGGVATNTSTNCGKLFSYTTINGVAPTDVFGAAINIAKNPAQNVSSLFTNLIPSPAPFATTQTLPNDWSLSVVYSNTGVTNFSSPKGVAVDANGQVWVANSGNNTVAVLAQTGAAISGAPFSGNGLSTPIAVAIDSSGNAWVADSGSTKVSVFTNTGGTFSGSPFTVGTGPVSIAIDAPGNVWVGNGSSSLSELSSTGSTLQTITLGGIPNAIAIDPK